MKKVCVLLLLGFLLILSGCSHSHTWIEATCTAPKTCSVCGETEGVALGHTWTEATCTVAKTCRVCNETEGVPLEHAWVEATCIAPKTCSVCGETNGTALGHNAPELTCLNDAICVRCSEIISAPGHTMTEATCIEPEKCTACGEISGKALGHTTTSGVCSRCGLETYETISGYGDDVISNISVGSNIYRVHFTHSGKRNFIVKSYTTDDSDLLINEIGNYDGYVLLSGTSPFAFEITADGFWTYTIESLAKIPDTSFAGKGDYVTGICQLSSGAWEFTHDGSHNFIVRMYTTSGRDLLINEIGGYNGKKMVKIPSGSYAFFEITADGNWTIKEA